MALLSLWVKFFSASDKRSEILVYQEHNYYVYGFDYKVKLKASFYETS